MWYYYWSIVPLIATWVSSNEAVISIVGSDDAGLVWYPKRFKCRECREDTYESTTKSNGA